MTTAKPKRSQGPARARPLDGAASPRAARPSARELEELLRGMTLEEKIDQLHQCGVGDATPNNLRLRKEALRPTFGSYILNGKPDRVLRDRLQERALRESRLGVPALFAADVIHGYRTIFPIPLAQACAWDEGLARRACRAAAREAVADGVDWTFAPVADQCVDPRWGRIAETFGESPVAASRLVAASIEGYQEGPCGIAACLKHFAGYGASEGGRDYTFTEVSDQTLWDRHLPPFEAGVRAGAWSVMSGFNDLGGVPASANPFTLTEVLRRRWRFRGVVVSDWNAVLQLQRQGFAADGAEAAARALSAGVDIDMADGLYRAHLPRLVASGVLPVAAVDEAVRRLLRMKSGLGLFEFPFGRPAVQGADGAEDPLALADDFASRTLVLLKNRGLLPLAGGVSRLALIGPLAGARQALLGSWALQGRAEEVATIEEALRERLPAGTRLDVARGCGVEDDDRSGLDEAARLAQGADAVVLCLGEEAHMSGENASRSSLRLAGAQEALAHAVCAAGRPVVLVLVSGRPLEIAGLEPALAAIVAAWQPGTRGGTAIADLLLGRAEPSGRLAVTWPRTAGQIPLYDGMRPRARGGLDGAHRDLPDSPLYPLGHGLSYTTFEYGSLRLSARSVAPGGTLRAEITVANRGGRAGRETVLWFLRDPAASVTRPLRELRHFESAEIPPGASRVFSFEISPRRDLAFRDARGRLRLEAGEFHLSAGPRNARFELLP